MATNTKKGHRLGPIINRSQFELENGHWVKRDTETGKFLDIKSDDKPFKGVAKEPDDRK